MNPVLFQFRVQSAANQQHGFELTSSGDSTVDFHGKDYQGNPYSETFKVDREELARIKKFIEPSLLETTDFNMSQTTDDGYFWSMKYTVAGVSFSFDGYIPAEDVQEMKEKSRHILHFLEDQDKDDDENFAALKRLLKQAAILHEAGE